MNGHLKTAYDLGAQEALVKQAYFEGARQAAYDVNDWMEAKGHQAAQWGRGVARDVRNAGAEWYMGHMMEDAKSGLTGTKDRMLRGWSAKSPGDYAGIVWDDGKEHLNHGLENAGKWARGVGKQVSDTASQAYNGMKDML